MRCREGRVRGIGAGTLGTWISCTGVPISSTARNHRIVEADGDLVSDQRVQAINRLGRLVECAAFCESRDRAKIGDILGVSGGQFHVAISSRVPPVRPARTACSTGRGPSCDPNIDLTESGDLACHTPLGMTWPKPFIHKGLEHHVTPWPMTKLTPNYATSRSPYAVRGTSH